MGRIHAHEPEFKAASNKAVFYQMILRGQSPVYVSIPVDAEGRFEQTIPGGSQLELFVDYDAYAPIDTVVDLNGEDTVFLSLSLSPSLGRFSAKTARIDIQNRNIRLLFHDPIMREVFRDKRFSEKYGFHFYYIETPASPTTQNGVYRYNATMDAYLDSTNGPGWRGQMYADLADLSRKIETREMLMDPVERLASFRFPKRAILPVEMEGSLNRLLRAGPKPPGADSLSLYQALAILERESDYRQLSRLGYWFANQYEDAIPALIERSLWQQEVGLTQAAGVIIWERVETGDLPLYGPGAEVEDDLFSVAGRANYFLKLLTGEHFGTIKMNAAPIERKEIQARWLDWMRKL
ncbi:MAG: hypothetical protein AAF206_28185 [Bacteroidota bacterium]